MPFFYVLSQGINIYYCCHVTLCHVTLCHVTLCHVTLCHVTLCHVTYYVPDGALCICLFVGLIITAVVPNIAIVKIIIDILIILCFTIYDFRVL
jgi:hypothetical protein